MNPTLKVDQLTTEIRLKSRAILPVENLSFEIYPGETLGIVGESGSGKTMAAMSIIGLLPPGGRVKSGSVIFDDKDLTKITEKELQSIRGRQIGTVFQNPMTSLNPSKTIGWQIAESLRIHKMATKKEARDRALEVINLVGIPEAKRRIDEFPHQLSGGMRQRAMIAIALACEPKLLIADEPTTALDVTIQAQILSLLEDLKQRLSMALLLVTHDMGVIAGHADRVLVMYGGRMREEADVEQLFSAMRHPYTQALLSSIPRVDDIRTPYLPVIAGLPPDLIDPAPGCKFAPRCTFASTKCEEDEPSETLQNHRHRYSCYHPVAGPLHIENKDPLESVTPPTGDSLRPKMVLTQKISKVYNLHSQITQRQVGQVRAVSEVDLEVREGETLGIVGESGCGKSTLARLLVGLEPPSEGQISLDGQEITQLRKKDLRRKRRNFQMMFQDPYSSLDPRMTIEESIAEPLISQGIGDRQERKRLVHEMIREVGLLDSSLARYPHEFSGGQLQRVGFARTLILSPKVVVADEPVSALDVSVRSQILNLMKTLQERHNLTYIVISHDLSVINFLADRVGVMYLGRIVEIGTTDSVFRRPAHPYTKALLDSVPVPDPKVSRLKRAPSIDGELPSPINPPSGCHFRTRCPFAIDLCSQSSPTLQELDDNHLVRCHRAEEASLTRTLSALTP
jgi:peptide/nickel transport system ATP-binding protein